MTRSRREEISRAWKRRWSIHTEGNVRSGRYRLSDIYVGLDIACQNRSVLRRRNEEKNRRRYQLGPRLAELRRCSRSGQWRPGLRFSRILPRNPGCGRSQEDRAGVHSVAFPRRIRAHIRRRRRPLPTGHHPRVRFHRETPHIFLRLFFSIPPTLPLFPPPRLLHSFFHPNPLSSLAPSPDSYNSPPFFTRFFSNSRDLSTVHSSPHRLWKLLHQNCQRYTLLYLEEIGIGGTIRVLNRYNCNLFVRETFFFFARDIQFLHFVANISKRENEVKKKTRYMDRVG